MMKLKAITRSGFLTKMEEAKKRGSLRKRASSFDTTLLFICGNDLFVGKLLLIKHVGCNDETGIFPDLCFHLLLIDGKGRHHKPHSFLRQSIFFWLACTLIACL